MVTDVSCQVVFGQKVLLNAPRNEPFDQQILSLAALETPPAKHGYTPGDYGIGESNEGLHIWQRNIPAQTKNREYFVIEPPPTFY